MKNPWKENRELLKMNAGLSCHLAARDLQLIKLMEQLGNAEERINDLERQNQELKFISDEPQLRIRCSEYEVRNKFLSAEVDELKTKIALLAPKNTYRITYHDGTYEDIEAHSRDENHFYANGTEGAVFVISEDSMLSVRLIEK